MSASLVGSEMCIRDRFSGPSAGCLRPTRLFWPEGPASVSLLRPKQRTRPVSYTHLTLPTICSV
eukprot:5724733-Alexandrium_andersonii.AAC.1